MRLLRLYLGDHRVLQELEIQFGASWHRQSNGEKPYHLDFLVGVNGSGKSTVLRILARIFQSTQIQVIETPFIVEYWLPSQQKKVRISNIHPVEKTPLGAYFLTTRDTLDDNFGTDDPDPEELMDNIPADLIPDRIIAYTTGEEKSWQFDGDIDPFERSSIEILTAETTIEEQARKELPGWVTVQEETEVGYSTNFQLIPKEQLGLVALCGLLIDNAYSANAQERPLYNIFQESKIHAFSGFSLKLNLRNASLVERQNVRERLAHIATRAIKNGEEYRLVFDLSHPGISQMLLLENGSGLELFEFLSRLYGADSEKDRRLSEISLFFERMPEKEKSENGEEIIKLPLPHLHTWEWLSDGEQSFLGRMCLFLLLGDTESLILLDEPEVHFNDFWKRHIVRLIDDIIQRKNRNLAEDQRTVSHILIATHSSIALTDVQPDDILILERAGLHTSETRMPKIKTFGADPSEIMVHVFGAPHASGQYSVNEIDNWLTIASQKSEEERKKYLEARLKEVAPGYWAYRIRREMAGLSVQ